MICRWYTNKRFLPKWLFALGVLSFLGAMPSCGGEWAGALALLSEAVEGEDAQNQVNQILQAHHDGKPFGKEFLPLMVNNYQNDADRFRDILQKMITYGAIEQSDFFKGNIDGLSLLEHFILYDKEKLFIEFFRFFPASAYVYQSEFSNDRDDLKKCFAYYAFALLTKMVERNNQNHFENVLYKIATQIEEEEDFIFDELLKDLDIISPLRWGIQGKDKNNYYEESLFGEPDKNTKGISVISAFLKLDIATEVYELLERKKNYLNKGKALKDSIQAIDNKLSLLIDHYGLPRLQRCLLIKEINEENCQRIKICNKLRKIQPKEKKKIFNRVEKTWGKIREVYKTKEQNYPSELFEMIVSYGRKLPKLEPKITPKETFDLLQKVAKVENKTQKTDFEFLASLFTRKNPYALFLKYYDKCENGELAAAAFRAFVKKMNDKYAEGGKNHKAEYFFRDQLMKIVKSLLEEGHPLLDKKVKLADGKEGSFATFLVDEVFCGLAIAQPNLPIYLAKLSEKMKENHKPLKIDITKHKDFLPRLFEKNPKNLKNVSSLWGYGNEDIFSMRAKKIQRKITYNIEEREEFHTKFDKVEKEFAQNFGIKNLKSPQKFTNQKKDVPLLMKRVKRLKNIYNHLITVLDPTKQLGYKNTKDQKDQEGHNILEIEAYSARDHYGFWFRNLVKIYPKYVPQLCKNYLKPTAKARFLGICDGPNDDPMNLADRREKKEELQEWLEDIPNAERASSWIGDNFIIIFSVVYTIFLVPSSILVIIVGMKKREAQKKKNATLRAKKRLKKREKIVDLGKESRRKKEEIPSKERK